MKLAIVGTGRMGAAVREVALARGHHVTATFDSQRPLPIDASQAEMCGAEVAIDFTVPQVAVAHISAYCRWGQPAVIGTTGWEVESVRRLVAAHKGTLLVAPNFSLGVQLLRRAIQGMGALLDQLPEYDVALSESHHTGKVDRPSGTALLLAEELRTALRRKRTTADPLEISSLRVGHVFGEHTVTLDSIFDQISLTHIAKSRRGFALGALKAAEWLPGRFGLYTLDDAVADWLS